jgi:hypothetical protein
MVAVCLGFYLRIAFFSTLYIPAQVTKGTGTVLCNGFLGLSTTGAAKSSRRELSQIVLSTSLSAFSLCAPDPVLLLYIS